MAYDEGLAERIWQTLEDEPLVSEKKMFGGVAFLHQGRMFVGIVKDALMVRVGPPRYEEALRAPATRPMDFTGKPMLGYIYVAPEGHCEDEVLASWVKWGLEFAKTLPVKPAKPKPKSKAKAKPTAKAAKKKRRRS